MKIKEITDYLESLAPLSSQESYDNCGLLVGDASAEVTNALLTLDCTEAIVEEAERKGCNLIIAHHPIVFKGLKKLNGKNYVERTILSAIRKNIAIYAIHTNLDNYRFGVNHEIAERIGLTNVRILQPKTEVLSKLAVYCPTTHVNKVAQALFEAGAGRIGNYSECSFEVEGTGAFKPEEGSNPVIGQQGTREQLAETKLEVLCSNHHLNAIVSAMLSAHPYEEVAYDLVPLNNLNSYEGSGMIGSLAQPMPSTDFLQLLKDRFHTGCIRHTALVRDNIQTVAFCGGSGSFLLPQAIRQKADIYITGDFKYHEFFDAENHLIIADIGHYESEQFTPNLLNRILKKKFINFAPHLSEVSTNPINYF